MLYHLSYGRAAAPNDREALPEGQAVVPIVLALAPAAPVSAPVRAL